MTLPLFAEKRGGENLKKEERRESAVRKPRSLFIEISPESIRDIPGQISLRENGELFFFLYMYTVHCEDHLTHHCISGVLLQFHPAAHC